MVKLAQTIVPDLEWDTSREDAGDVSIITQQTMYNLAKTNDLIICRKNSDVIDVYTKLAFEMRKPVCMVNLDLVNKITNEIRGCINQYIKYFKLGYNIQVELKDRLDELRASSSTPLTAQQYKEYQTNLIAELIDKNNNNKPELDITVPNLKYLKICMDDYAKNGNYTIDTVCLPTTYYDKIMYLIKKYEYEPNVTQETTVDEFIKYIPELFKYKKLGNNSIVVSSIHQMKGGEADNVYIYDYPAFPYEFQSMSDEQALQESNLQYVALTRAKKNLSLVLLDETRYRTAGRDNMECRTLVNNVLKN